LPMSKLLLQKNDTEKIQKKKLLTIYSIKNTEQWTNNNNYNNNNKVI